MSYDRSYCEKLDSVKSELEAVLAKVGLSLDSVKYTIGYELSVKLNLSDKSNVQATDNSNFMQNYYCKTHGLPENIVGKNVLIRGTHYKVVSIDHRKPKNSIVLSRMKDNKTFVCSPDFIKKVA